MLSNGMELELFCVFEFELVFAPNLVRSSKTLSLSNLIGGTNFPPKLATSKSSSGTKSPAIFITAEALNTNGDGKFNEVLRKTRGDSTSVIDGVVDWLSLMFPRKIRNRLWEFRDILMEPVCDGEINAPLMLEKTLSSSLISSRDRDELSMLRFRLFMAKNNNIKRICLLRKPLIIG